MLELLQDEGFKKAPGQAAGLGIPERYLPMHSDLSQFNQDWLAQLRADGNRDERLASNQAAH